ncbi:TlpA family protein disulfide reductase [Rhodopirellula sp. MGV]|uniref:TlpA family protein disulfide reductase n=1 Tax=Rhodopirellula sp. MGV TaxID=2023130 RepID=UPI00117ADF64|nr:hypothetical protein [Rhodopirellula sp. MGV]
MSFGSGQGVSGEAVKGWLDDAVTLASAKPSVVVGNWPPVKGQPFPELQLADQNGDLIRWAEFKGKVILVEYVASSCEGCQAFSGGARVGAYAGGSVQRELESIETYSERYAGVQLGKDVVFVQVLLYGAGNRAPTAEEVSEWASHFHFDRRRNQIVLRGTAAMLNRATYEKIPGFHLVDRQFVLRSDSCGHHPVDDLYQELLPLMGRLARH